ncbi:MULTISPECIES: flavodoxin family protein [unclassified Bradyrhizobium]|nr:MULTISPECIES: flavodoxin [unclassified Bradyrhizobium]
MRTLVVFYSLSGTTRAVAQVIAKALSADVEDISCARYQRSFGSYLRASYDSWSNSLPQIGRLQHAPSDYDLVVVGSPIWAWRPATPIRAYLQAQAGKLNNVAFFLTHGGSPPGRSFREMKDLAGAAPKATVAIRQIDVANSNFGPAVSRFAASLRDAMAG